MLSLFVVMGLLIVWFVGFGGGGAGKKNEADGPDGKHPAPSITPGPSSPGPAISDRPGGRDETGDGGGSGGSTGGDGSEPSASASEDDGDPAGSRGGSQAGGGSGTEVPASSSLPVCTPGAVHLSLRSLPNSYGPGENPHIQLTAHNSSSAPCKIDLGPKRTVLTITRTDGDKRIWASDDCPRNAGTLYLKVPADASITHTTTWSRKSSAPHCAKPPTTPVSPGTYLVEAQSPTFPKLQTSFVLNED